jgi:hypothetical protein
VFDQIAQDGHILFAGFGDAILVTVAPPLNGLDAVTLFRRAQRIFCKLVEFYSMPEQLVKIGVHVKRALAQALDRRVLAQNLEIEAIAIERDDVREAF